MIFSGQNHVFIACVFPVWFTLSGSLADRSAGNSGYDSVEPAVRVDWSAAKDEHWGWFQPNLIWICNWMLNLWCFSFTLIWIFQPRSNVKIDGWNMWECWVITYYPQNTYHPAVLKVCKIIFLLVVPCSVSSCCSWSKCSFNDQICNP